MRRQLILVCSAAAAAAALASTGSAITKPQVFSLLDVSGPTVAIDPGGGENDTPRLGARFAFTDVLYKRAGPRRGARVGRLEGLCTYQKVDLEARAATVYCTVNAYLPAGQMLLGAFIRFAERSGPTFRVVVTGGVGAYAGARGYVNVTSVGGLDSNKSNLEFHLMP